MSVKKALSDLDLLMEYKKQIKSSIQDLLYQWRNDNEDVVSRNAKLLVRLQQKDLDWLCGIKRQLLLEKHSTKMICRHPKKEHDTCDGQEYCMACNMNL